MAFDLPCLAMDAFGSPSHPQPLFSMRLPPQHCAPSNEFLVTYSSIFHTCIPTPLALISTVLGCLSILSWLFAQLPQIIKNHWLKSTSGLSIYFLAEWCLGDMSNLFGALLTGQATWQIVIGAYYCLVDIVLIGQWAWFEGLGRGRGIPRAWRRVRRRTRDEDDEDDAGDMQQVIEGVDPRNGKRPSPEALYARPIANDKRSVFSTPDYGSLRSTKDEHYISPSDNTWTIYRRCHAPSPSPSPRTVLFLSMTLCILSTTVSATPVSTNVSPPHNPYLHLTIPPLGTVLSWASTTFYLVSRLPQLLKNFRLRSTAGLSPLLFAAAFSGNFFYSASLLLSPNLWHDYGPYRGGGWAGPEGNDRAEWMFKALPFFLGAAGVLVMDAGIGVQFWLWGGIEVGREETAFTGSEDVGRNVDGKKWRRVSGWMRGWVPSTRLGRRLLSETAGAGDAERESLLRDESA